MLYHLSYFRYDTPYGTVVGKARHTGALRHIKPLNEKGWAGEDSNLRTLREQIYSLPPLTTRQPARYCRRTRSEKTLSKTPV